MGPALSSLCLFAVNAWQCDALPGPSPSLGNMGCSHAPYNGGTSRLWQKDGMGHSFCVRSWSSGPSCSFNPTRILSEYTVYGTLARRPNNINRGSPTEGHSKCCSPPFPMCHHCISLSVGWSFLSYNLKTWP